MRFTDQLVLVCALLTASSEANPLTQKHNPKSFSVKEVGRPAAPRQYRGKHAMNRVRRKYGSGSTPAAPPLQHNQQPIKASSKQKSKVEAPPGAGQTTAESSDKDLEYVCEVYVGDTKMKLNFDTGSSDLWVYSTLQPSDQKTNHTLYDPKNSTKAQEVKGATWQISYGDQSGASGVVYKDTVKVGNVVADGQAIELAQNVSSSFLGDNSNAGLLGLGFSKGTAKGSGNTISTNGKADPQETFFGNVKSKLPLPLFTADLKHNAPGSYDFGFIDKSKYTGDIKYFPADSSSAYWGVTSQRYAVKGQKGVEKSIKTIVDTGTTLLLMPQDVLDAYYKQVPKSRNDTNLGGYVYPCGTKLPDFEIGFGSAPNEFTATIPSTLMDFGSANTDDPATCFGAMQIMSVSDSLDAIYGDIFLKAVFTVFEAKTDDKPRLGFAMKPDANSNPYPTPTGSGATPTSSPAPSCSDTPGADDKGKQAGVTIFANWFNALKLWIGGGKKDKDTCPAPPAGSGSPDSGDGGDGIEGGDGGDDGDDKDDGSDESDDDEDKGKKAKEGKKATPAKKIGQGRKTGSDEKRRHQKRQWEEDYYDLYY